MTKDGLAALEGLIGRTFRDRELLEQALTHSSLSGAEDSRNLERLEFLGDRVLGLLAAEALYKRHPDMAEGELAPRLNTLVRKETCAAAALELGLDTLVRMSANEEAAGGRRKAAILGDVTEAFLGALYLDGGLDAARAAFDSFWTPNLDALSQAHRDPKTALQEWSQERRRTPDYVVIASGGPAHAPAFEVEVRIDGHQSARGQGRSKREAQAEAALAFLRREKIWTDRE